MWQAVAKKDDNGAELLTHIEEVIDDTEELKNFSVMLYLFRYTPEEYRNYHEMKRFEINPKQ
ncbi:hypothetical protein PsorP6_015508 [Peronosclerospora sorghi]|uniref:Uncharacterized protein n=1 Tax=Peronosclerospora sorghi TaxID=230839 RepID=A0ACC0WQD0_9STRA|nr:hypothetical protein PsorP6_015508 [Peronosclerospora sorghi]